MKLGNFQKILENKINDCVKKAKKNLNDLYL